MFQALIIENDKQIINQLTETLRSMNFSCLVAETEKEAKSMLKQHITSIGIIFACMDHDRLDGITATLIQWGMGYERPVLGLTLNEEIYQKHMGDSMLPDGVAKVIYIQQDEMEMRDLIDQVFYDYNLRKADRKQKVLIVEDNINQAELLALKLIKIGYEPFRAIDGSHGHSSLPLIKPDIILLDMNMPVMDGETFARMLKANEKTKNIPIIGISADTNRQKSLDAGCDTFLQKPLKFDQLEQKLQELLPPGRRSWAS